MTEKARKFVQINVNGDAGEAYTVKADSKEIVKFQSPRTATMQQQYLQRRRTGGVDRRNTGTELRLMLANDELQPDGSTVGGGVLSRI